MFHLSYHRIQGATRKLKGKMFYSHNTHSPMILAAERETQAMRALEKVVEPITGSSIMSCGILKSVTVSDDGALKIFMDFLIPGFTYKNQLRQACLETTKSLPWTSKVTIVESDPTASSGLGSIIRPMADSSATPSNNSRIFSVIGVSSCKGGVGKSTVAVNLAFSLLEKGLRVGLLDADIYGPSLPFLVPAQSQSVRRSPQNPRNILPLESLQSVAGEGNVTGEAIEGDGRRLKMLSFGHVNPHSGAPGAGGKSAAIVRGPIASKIINQMLFATEWGDLDYLVVDMPPGTGDVQITLTQGLSFGGCVIVTTPHRLSLVDAAKGVAMLDELRVPTLALVENMSYFEVDEKRYFPFGQGGRGKLLQSLAAISSSSSSSSSLERLQQCPMHAMPLLAHPADSSDASEGDVLTCPNATYPHPLLRAEYAALADSVLCELFKQQAEAILTPSVHLLKSRAALMLRYFSAHRAEELIIPQRELRWRDARTGEVRPDLYHPDSSNHSAAELLNISVRGRYGVALQWSDGRRGDDIFSFEALRKIASDCAVQGQSDI